MALALSNTNQLVNRLKESGLTEKQAQAITDVVQQIDLSDLMTRMDFDLGMEQIRGEINRSKVTMIMWVVGLLVAQTAFLLQLIK